MPHADNPSVLIDAFLRPVFHLYYWWTTVLDYLMPPIRWDGLTIAVRPGICRPAFFEHRMAAGCGRGERVLDLGCGSGIVSVAAARLGATVTAADINPNALLNTIQNCELNGVTNVITLRSDLLDSVEGQFDRIITHPPYIELTMEGENNQWATAKGFVERFFAKAADHLSPGGTAVVMFPGSQGSRLETLAIRSGLCLLSSTPVGWMGVPNFIERLLYFEVAFAPVIYTFGREAALQREQA